MRAGVQDRQRGRRRTRGRSRARGRRPAGGRRTARGRCRRGAPPSPARAAPPRTRAPSGHPQQDERRARARPPPRPPAGSAASSAARCAGRARGRRPRPRRGRPGWCTPPARPAPGVDTGQCGCCAARRGDQVGAARGRSRRAARPAPTSWSGCAPPAARAGRAGRPATPARPGTVSANASSTSSTRPGRASAATASAGCSTDVGLVGLPSTTRSASSGTAAGSQPVAVVGAQQQPLDRVPGGAQRRLRLGERRVDDDRAAGRQRAGDQHERLGGAGGEQHLVRGRGRARRRRRRAPGRASG